MPPSECAKESGKRIIRESKDPQASNMLLLRDEAGDHLTYLNIYRSYFGEQNFPRLESRVDRSGLPEKTRKSWATKYGVSQDALSEAQRASRAIRDGLNSKSSSCEN
jgi:hypothetical protein